MDEKQCSPCDEPVVRKLPPCPLQCGSKRCRSFKPGPPVLLRPIVWLIGGPGSGKRTICDKIATKYGFTWIKIRDLFMIEKARGSERAKCLVSVLERGERVPKDLILDLLKESIFTQAEKAKGFVIEGFPRERSEILGFEKTIAPPSIILYLEASSATLVQRMKDIVPRSEDEVVESKELRVERFHEKNILILAQYPEKIKRVNANKSIDEVFVDVQKFLDPVVEQYAEYAKYR